MESFLSIELRMMAALVKARDILQMLAEGVRYEDALEQMPLGVDWESLISIEIRRLLQRSVDADEMEQENLLMRKVMEEQMRVVERLQKEVETLRSRPI